MSKELHNTEAETRPRHGAIGSYITGFVLSLVFTLIPYYMVVQKSVSGSVLLATIIGFAILQMIVQVVFFLHLGREKKPYWQTGFLFATVGAIFVVVVGSIWIMHHLHYNMNPTDVADKVSEGEAVHQINGEQTGTCAGGTGTNHKVVFDENKANPRHTDAQLCDTITFSNEDDVVRDIAFGSHPDHGSYAGETDLLIYKGRNKVLTLTKAGEYNFHDHMQPEVAGEFSVSE